MVVFPNGQMSQNEGQGGISKASKSPKIRNGVIVLN